MSESSEERYDERHEERYSAVQAEAAQTIIASMRATTRGGFPKPGTSIAPPIERDDARLTGELVPASCVELEEAVGEDSIVLVGRDPDGAVLLKIWMRRADASPEWGLWVRRWITRKSRQALRLMR